MKHLLEISQLSAIQINHLIDRALDFKRTRLYPNFSEYTLANLFYENSTRTRVSFELAAKRLSMVVSNIDINKSSEAKGETIEDTISTLAAMGIDIFVIRHHQNYLQRQLAEKFNKQIQIINAGDGHHAHPSQALLDAMTVKEKKKDFSKLNIAIIGDIRHSRVANSLQCLYKTLNVKHLFLVAPKLWQPEKIHFGEVTDSLHQGIRDADVIVSLRVQKERLLAHEHLDLANYRDKYAITASSIKHAKNDVIIMHPGPINRNVEIDGEVADGPHSVILEQVTNGVFMRMAILEFLVNSSLA